MLSPFPGMDPFLERASRWQAFHNKLVAEFEYQLADRLPDRYEVRSEAAVYLHEIPFDGRRLLGYADGAAVVSGSGALHGGASAAVAAEPTARGVLLPHVFERTEMFLQVRDADGQEVVTVIELLSRSNKERHRDQYLAKRDAVLHSPTHLIEIDLLRHGRPHHLGQTPAGPIEPSTAYRCLVARAGDLSDHAGRSAEIWEFGLRDPLPVLSVPLRDGEAVTLDLRAALDVVYHRSRAERSAYKLPPDPPLPPADAAWAADVLRGVGVPLPPNFPPAE